MVRRSPSPVKIFRRDVREAGSPRTTSPHFSPGFASTWFVCGSARFAESLTRLIVDGGVPSDRVRVERFGPTG